jgi:prepilin-type N-terminal cleavage/methylation domain-containing protein
MARSSALFSSGFTLLELLVTLTIIGILVASSIPNFQGYRRRAYDARAQGDLRSVALAEEAYFLESERYLPCENSGCAALPGIARLSDGVTLQITTDETTFVGTASHPKGSGKTFTWESAQGGMGTR